ncbi:ABC transporter B family member 2-like [Coffea eugenioides]|uniref:ABC transporter B family member 2-like n=1 Tax=Coffea eugenioides TaxID=49369 RepID=UPI000F612A98|nr:ABC transporter B family member 2-like [Coffea eugenioides]
MAIATFPAGVVEIGCWMHASQRQVSRLRLAFLRAVLRQEMGAFDTDLSSAKVITGITDHMRIIQDAIGEKVRIFKFAPTSSSSFVLSPSLMASTNERGGGGGDKKLVIDTIQIKTVYAFVGENRAIKSLSKCLEKQLILSKQEALIKGAGTGMFQTVTFTSWALIVWVGAVVVVNKRSTGGDVIAAVMSILFGAISLTYAAPDMQIFNQAKAAGKEVFQVIQRKSAINSDSKGKILEAIDGNIDLRNIYFAYPSRQEKVILQGFSFSIPAGKVVALVGSSGCGKSTIISLLARFYDPEKGDIFIDNHNIKELDLKFLRRNLGLVSQEPSLFAGNIKDNIKIGKMDADDEEIQHAALLANADSFISQLPDKYLTEQRENGTSIQFLCILSYSNVNNQSLLLSFLMSLQQLQVTEIFTCCIISFENRDPPDWNDTLVVTHIKLKRS